MKLSHLYESTEKPTVVKARRALKFSVKNGENDLNLDMASLKCEYYTMKWPDRNVSTDWVMVIGRPGFLKKDVAYDFEKDEKAGISAITNAKLSSGGLKVFDVADTFEAGMVAIKKIKPKKVVVDPDLLKDAGTKKAEPKSELDPAKDGYFLLGYWGNPYSKHDEYFWSGPYKERKNALALGKRKQDRGQPKTFTDWVKGENKAIQGLDKFVAAAKKVGLNPKVDPEDMWFHDDE